MNTLPLTKAFFHQPEQAWRYPQLIGRACATTPAPCPIVKAGWYQSLRGLLRLFR
jgi:hypothetical protein